MAETKFTSKIALYLQVPVQNLADNKEVKAAYAALLEQLIDYAKAAEKEPNVLKLDTVFITTPEDYAKRSDSPVNVHLAEVMAQRVPPALKQALPKAKDEKPVPDKAVAQKPAPKAAKVEEKDPDEKPCVKAVDWQTLKDQAAEQVAAETKPEAAPAAEEKIKVTKAVHVADDDVKAITDKIFEDLKRTEKSVTILTAFAKAGGEVDLDELVKATKMDKNDLCSWLNQTGKKVKAIEKTGRGKYRLNPDKV